MSTPPDDDLNPFAWLTSPGALPDAVVAIGIAAALIVVGIVIGSTVTLLVPHG